MYRSMCRGQLLLIEVFNRQRAIFYLKHSPYAFISPSQFKVTGFRYNSTHLMMICWRDVAEIILLLSFRSRNLNIHAPFLRHFHIVKRYLILFNKRLH